MKCRVRTGESRFSLEGEAGFFNFAGLMKAAGG